MRELLPQLQGWELLEDGHVLGKTFRFADYYRTTILSEESDPNKLHDLKAALDAWQVYAPEQVDEISKLFLGGARRDALDPILDACVGVYLDQLDEDGQVDFKGKAKAFTRTYDFLASILPYTNAGWERLSILLNFLIPKLPAPREEDLSRGILESIDMDSYRVEKQAVQTLQPPDEEGVIDPVPVVGGGRKPEPELDRLSNILERFNEQFGTLFEDADRVARRFREDIAPKVAADTAYQNAKLNTPQTARIEHDRALGKVMLELLKDDTEVYKQFVENPSFKRFVTDLVFGLTSGGAATSRSKRPSPTPPSGLADLQARLAGSDDPRDRLGAVLVAELARSGRVTLGDAIRGASERGLGDDDALAAVERLARPGSAALRRFYVDRSGAVPRIVGADEVRERAAQGADARRAWTSAVEVVWAASEADALARGEA